MAVLDELSGVTVTDINVAAAVGRLQINTLGGDDLVTVDVGRHAADHGADHVRRRSEQRSAAGPGNAARRGGTAATYRPARR